MILSYLRFDAIPCEILSFRALGHRARTHFRIVLNTNEHFPERKLESVDFVLILTSKFFTNLFTSNCAQNNEAISFKYCILRHRLKSSLTCDRLRPFWLFLARKFQRNGQISFLVKRTVIFSFIIFYFSSPK